MFKLSVLCPVFSLLCLGIETYNLDVDHAILFGKPSNEAERSYFGYSVALYRDSKGQSKWLVSIFPYNYYANYLKFAITMVIST